MLSDSTKLEKVHASSFSCAQQQSKNAKSATLKEIDSDLLVEQFSPQCIFVSSRTIP